MITVLRIGHRRVRDARLSTHVGLTARAFGADAIVYSGEKDEKLLDSVKNVVNEWGGSFSVSYEKNWRKVLEEFKGTKVHLTFYGLPVQKVIGDIQKKKTCDVLIVVGSEKVPFEVYKSVDFNVAVTNQPHSEVAALAVFLHEYFHGKELEKKFRDWRRKILPKKCGKTVVEK